MRARPRRAERVPENLLEHLDRTSTALARVRRALAKLDGNLRVAESAVKGLDEYCTDKLVVGRGKGAVQESRLE